MRLVILSYFRSKSVICVWKEGGDYVINIAPGYQ